MKSRKGEAGGRNSRQPIKGVLAAVLSAALLLPTAAMAAEASDGLDNSGIRLYEVFDVLGRYHVSGTDSRVLSDSGIRAMIEQLNDPYTTYMTPEEWKTFQYSLEQAYVGVGIQLEDTDSGIVIVRTFPGTPAEQAGLLPGDQVLAVNGQSAASSKASELSALFPKRENAGVTVTVERDGARLDVPLIVRKVQIPAVTGRMLGQTGYLKIDTFTSDADEAFAAELKTLKERGVQSLIVDLRNNPGGILETAQNIAKLFVKDGILIHTRNRDGSDDPVLISGGQEQAIPVVVLVNENSASSSEVLAGALQDYGKATVVGMRTYGKGSVQSTFELSGGGAIKVTMEEYYTPLNRQVNRIGLAPDIEVDGGAAQLAAALRLAGEPVLRLDQQGMALTMNGEPVEDIVPVIREDGRVYVHTRVLAALIGGTVSWQQQEQAAEVTAAGRTERFRAGETLINIAGTSLVELSAFADRFPALRWTDDGGKLTLEASLPR